MKTRAAILVVAATLAGAGRAADIPTNQRHSTYDAMSAETRAMQDDDSANPASLSVLDGEALWTMRAGSQNKSCADCHGADASAMKGAAARYPRFNAAREKPIDLEQQINICRTERQGAPPLAWESRDLLALEAYVAKFSRGLKISVPDDARLAPFIENGRKLFSERRGQVDLSCTQCHDDNWGKSLAGAPVPQGHPTAYPIYRLEWQSMGSLRRRLRNCLSGMRAELWPQETQAYVDLELFLMSRANGMAMESPGVRP